MKTLEEIIEVIDLDETIVKKMDSKGNRSKVKSAKVRKRRANQNSSLSRAERKKVARKAAKTRKRDVSGQRKALKKRKKAMRKRKQAGWD